MTPHYVVFGRHARLPVDMLYQVAPPQCRDTLEGWVRSHHQTLLQAYATVRNNAERRNHWNQMHYNRNTRSLPLLPGERVLMRNFRRRAQGKLAPHWLPTPFVIVGQSHPDRPVFTIRPEGKDGPCRTLHRNNLQPCLGDPPTINRKVQGRSSEWGTRTWASQSPRTLLAYCSCGTNPASSTTSARPCINLIARASQRTIHPYSDPTSFFYLSCPLS